ncbi:hypothetical protein COT72_02510, partial [archaeon CG10_big_fil_rev_8_21_14_0_10_43_11]
MRAALILFAFILFAFSPALGQDACSTTQSNTSGCTVSAPAQQLPITPVWDLGANELDHVCVLYFYTSGCAHCANTRPVIETLDKEYGDRVMVHYLQVSGDLRNYNLYNQYCSIQNIPLADRKVPLVVTANHFLMGEDVIKSELGPALEELTSQQDYTCPLPSELTCADIEKGGGTSALVPGAPSTINTSLIIISGLIDGINPCAFAVLIFFVGYLLSVSASKKRMLKAGIAYIISVYVTYFLAGLGVLSIIHIAGFAGIVFSIAAIVAILAGLINIKDFFWYGKGFSLQIPASKKKTIEHVARRANIPAAIILGFLVSLFELPCTGGIYLAILALLANTTTQTIGIP